MCVLLNFTDRVEVSSSTYPVRQLGVSADYRFYELTMLQITPQHRILLAVKPIDFRNGVDGLKAICRQKLCDNPFNGVVFAFRNKSGTSVKILVYDATGFWLLWQTQVIVLNIGNSTEATGLVL